MPLQAQARRLAALACSWLALAPAAAHPLDPLMLWLTLGHHHVTQAEDWPVMSRHKLAFELKPVNFFDRNPALDLRRAPFELVR